MDVQQHLGQTLREVYSSAPDGESVTMIHLFGIKYADEIRRSGLKARMIIESSGIRDSYVTELQKGMRLSKYVTVKP